MLLIGESGVGKSRWINAFANYCKFRSLEEAVKAGGLFPIHCTFPIRDPQTGRMIYISSKGNDTTAISQPITVGDSVTKIPEDYGFVYEDVVINLIDTPGLMSTGDTSDHSIDMSTTFSDYFQHTMKFTQFALY